VGTEGEAPKDDGDRQDAVPQTRIEAIQEWFQGEHGGEEAIAARFCLKRCRLTYVYHRRTQNT